MKTYPLVIYLLLTTLISCRRTSDSVTASDKKQSTETGRATETPNSENFEYDLGELEGENSNWSKLKKLPLVESFLLKNFRTVTNDNLISDDPDYASTFHVFKSLKVNNNDALAILRLTEINSKSGRITLAVFDNNHNIIATAMLAEYFQESDSYVSCKSSQTGQGNFITKCHDSFPKMSEPDSKGTTEFVGSVEIDKEVKQKFESGTFIREVIDSTYKVVE